PELRISQGHIDRVRSGLPELPYAKKERFEKEYGIPAYAAFILTQERNVADFYEQAVKDGTNVTISALEIANAMVNKRIDWEKMQPSQLVQALLKGRKLGVSGDILDDAVESVLEENEEAINKWKKGKSGALEFLVGQVMKKTKGQADPQKVREKLLEKLS
ncbi:hypothetical protein HY405_01810, partial [Candidatus Microgenomates bacterium]|nr:hypothetical protein [Candidatus Microgenomates bacterium]